MTTDTAGPAPAHLDRCAARHTEPSATRRRLLAAAGLLTLGGCAGLLTPTSWTVPEAELQRLLARDFPQQRRVLELIDVDIGLPALTLLPATNRVSTTTTISARERLFGGRWRGQLSVEAGLRWVAEDNSVRLTDVRVTGLAPADGSPLPPQSRAIASALAEAALQQRTLYRVPADRLARLREHGVEPASLDVTGQGLVIGLKPLQPQQPLQQPRTPG